MRLISTMIGGTEDAEVEHRHETLAAGKHAAIGPGVAQNFQGFVEFARRAVIEPGRLHVRFNPSFPMGCLRPLSTFPSTGNSIASDAGKAALSQDFYI